MDLANGQGDHEVNRTHAQTTDDSSGGADGANKEPGSKMEQVAARLAEQVVARLSKENQNQNQKDIRTLAEAIQSIQKDIKTLKRKNEEALQEPAEKKQKSHQQDTEPIEIPGTSAVSDPESEAEDSDQELANFLGTGNEEEVELDNTLDDLESFFQRDKGTGDEVGDQIARITGNALRYSFDPKEESSKEKQKQLKKDQEKLDKLIEKHRRPKNIPNLATPMIEEFLWRQLKRNVKDTDYLHTIAVSHYNQALVPLVKALELMPQNKVPSQITELIMDAFKILSLRVKLTNQHRLDKVKKELLPKYKSLCDDGPSATNLMGDNFQEQAKKLEGTKHNLTSTMSHSFLGKRGGDNKNSNQSSNKSNQWVNHQYPKHKGFPKQQSNFKNQQNNHGKKQLKRK